MKKIFVLVFFLMALFSCRKEEAMLEEPIYIGVEVAPEFPGGDVEIRNFLNKTLNYPSEAIKAKVQGRVITQFLIEKDGTIGDVKILKGIGYGCDEEAVRVIRLMPKWIPGKMEGKVVRVYFTLPISFTLP